MDTILILTIIICIIILNNRFDFSIPVRVSPLRLLSALHREDDSDDDNDRGYDLQPGDGSPLVEAVSQHRYGH
jgi:hypothetical protein